MRVGAWPTCRDRSAHYHGAFMLRCRCCTVSLSISFHRAKYNVDTYHRSALNSHEVRTRPSKRVLTAPFALTNKSLIHVCLLAPNSALRTRVDNARVNPE